MKTVVYIRSSDIYNDSRATKEITSLVKGGYKVVVFGWDRTGKAKEKCKTTFSCLNDNVVFNFFDKKIKEGEGLRKNLFKLIKWFNWTKKEIKSIKNAFCVHACDLDGAMGVFKYCKKKQIKFVYDIYDYYVDSHSIPKFMQGWIENKEISIINGANLTIICTEERMQQISKSRPQKVLVLHNSPDVEEPLNNETKYDYVYCGSMGCHRLQEEILREYENNADLKIAFAGYGEHVLKCEEMDKNFDNFSYLGVLQYSDVLRIESSSKVLAALYDKTLRNHRLCAPNKFYESLALSKPIIVCDGTGIDKIVEQNDLGKVIEYDGKAFYKALRELLADEENLARIGKRSRLLYEEKYKWSLMQRLLLDGYGNLANGSIVED
ncbi:MAG: hypothetical protein IKA99_04840 [Clostridia bacterium]|nr:hypothetical protein [Clostridia bacterium]